MKNPFLNALSATAYIALVASVMSYGEKATFPDHGVLIPIAMLSLFVLSAAVMGYLFIYQPVVLYLNGEKATAVRFFLKTLVTFAVITALFFAAALAF